MINEKYHRIISILLLLVTILSITGIYVYKICSHNDDIAKVSYKYETELFKKDDVLDINIKIDEDTWNNMIETASTDEYVPCDITVNGTTYSTVGIRPKGNATLVNVKNDDSSDKFSFRIDFGKFIDGQTIDGLRTLVLNNMYGDATYMKEYLSLEMFEELGVSSPLYSYANVTVNGEQFGFYLAVEVMQEEFLSRTYGEEYGNLYKPETNEMDGDMEMGDKKDDKMPQMPDNNNIPQMPNMNNNPDNGNKDNNGGGMVRDTKGTNLVYIDDDIDSYSGIFDYTKTKLTDDADKKRLIQIIKQLNEGKNLDECVNVEEILRYFAVNTFAVNLDSYASNMKHNYYLYENNGKIEILPWDLHLSFGGFNMGNGSSLINFSVDEPVTDNMENSPLISKLLEVPEYKEMYYSYLQELIDNYVSSGKYEESINQVDSLISQYVRNDVNAFYTYDEYQTAIENLKIFFTDRTTSVENQMNGDTSTVETTLNAQALGTMGGGNGNMDKGHNMNPFGNQNMGNPMGNPFDNQNNNQSGNNQSPQDNSNKNTQTDNQNGDNQSPPNNANENSQNDTNTTPPNMNSSNKNDNSQNNNTNVNNQKFDKNQNQNIPGNILNGEMPTQNNYDLNSIIIILSSFASIIIAAILAKVIRRYR